MRKYRSWLLGALVLTLLASCGAPVVRADDDDDDDYRWRTRRVISTYGYPSYVAPLGYRSMYSSGPVVYRTYSSYDPFYNSGYGYYDSDGYRYYRDSGGSVVGRVLLSAILNNVIR